MPKVFASSCKEDDTENQCNQGISDVQFARFFIKDGPITASNIPNSFFSSFRSENDMINQSLIDFIKLKDWRVNKIIFHTTDRPVKFFVKYIQDSNRILPADVDTVMKNMPALRNYLDSLINDDDDNRQLFELIRLESRLIQVYQGRQFLEMAVSS